MSVRLDFLKDVESVCSNYSGNISICYAPDFEVFLGISYLELNKVSNDLSLYFYKYFGSNTKYIGVSVSDYFFLPCIILAIWKSGYCFAGVANQYTKKNNFEFLNFLCIKYLISDSPKNDYGGAITSEFVVNDKKYFVWDREPQIRQLERGDLDDICYGIMTSGSTGEPKMIQVPWSCILPNAVELIHKFQVTKDDCIFQGSPYSFDPFFIELFMALLSGCSLMVVSSAVKLSSSNLLRILFGVTEYSSKFSPSSCSSGKKENYFHINVQQIKQKNITILQMTPSVFKLWTNKEIKEFILSKNTPLKVLILGGERFPVDVLKLKCPNNNTRIFNIYGITEISCWTYLNEISIYSNDRISLGKPLHDVLYKIEDNGELLIGSSSRFCFVNEEKSCHFKNKVIFRNTGDIVEVVNNNIYYIGRMNQIFKKYGMKINLSKIESCFLNKNMSLKECYAVYDEETLKLALFYVPVISQDFDMNYDHVTLEEFLRSHIIPDDLKDNEKPDYFVKITKIPLNAHGKSDRQELLHVFKNIKTTKSELNVEKVFKNLWSGSLGLKLNNLFSSSFTELGGNSVLALNLITQLESEGFNVPQDFITILLGKKGYYDCLRCLSGAQEEYKTPSKRFKFDSNTGGVTLSIQWKFDLELCVDATPSFFYHKEEERIVIGSHSSKLSCLNAKSGHEIWTTYLGDRIESGFRPTKDGSKGFIGCYDGHVYCIDCVDGSTIWKFETGDKVKSTPCLSTDETIVYVGSYDTNLYCISVDEGQPKTTLKLRHGGIYCSGIISEELNNFYVGTLNGTCVAINQEKNEPVWKAKLKSPVFASPCLFSNQTEILFSEALGNVHCFNASTGLKKWTFQAGGNIYSSPIVEHVNNVNHIIFGCHDAHLYCIQYEKETELKWKQLLDSSVFAKPSVVGGSSWVCAATTKGFICVCDLNSGSLKTRLKLDGEVFSSPVYNKGRIFVGCRDNHIYGISILKSEN